MEYDTNFYNTSSKNQTSRTKQRIKHLYQRNKIDTIKVGKDILYNADQFQNYICKNGEIPLTAEEMNQEPHLYYSNGHHTTHKAEYAFKKLNIQKYMDMQTFKVCFKMNDVFLVEIKDMAKWYNIPEDEIKSALIKLWKKHNQDAMYQDIDKSED